MLFRSTAGALGCSLGSTAAYILGYIGGRPLIERWGKYVFLSTRELEMSERFFARYGSLTVFVCRLLPLVRTYIALPAGIARMNQFKFQLYTFVGSWIWCYVLAYIGMKLGEQWNTNPEMKHIMHGLDAVIGLAIIALAARFIVKHRRKKKA